MARGKGTVSLEEDAGVQGTGKPPVSSDAVKGSAAFTAPCDWSQGVHLVKAQAEP